MDNLRLRCSFGPPVENPFTGKYSEVFDGLRGDWTQEQICKPRQALCAFAVQTSEIINDASLEEYDNIAMTNVQMKCCNVPNIAITCQPKEDKRLVAVCDNSDGAEARKCQFGVMMGTRYNFSGPKNNTINFYESIGYTLPCQRPNLPNRFVKGAECSSNDKKCAFDWKDTPAGVWGEMKQVPKTITVPRKTTTNVYQVIGECGVYHIQTPKLLLVEKSAEGGGDEEKDAVEEQDSNTNAATDGPPPSKCWYENSNIPGGGPVGVLPEKKIPFHEISTAGQARTREPTGTILKNPEVTNVGQWAEEWLNCTNGSYISALGVFRYKHTGGGKEDFMGVTEFGFRCTTPEGKRNNDLNFKTPEFKNKEGIDWIACQDDGTGVGIVVNSLDDQGPGDDVATDNLKLICSIGRPALNSFEDPKYAAAGRIRGRWTKPQVCDPKQAACGAKAQFDPFSPTKEDNVAVNNLLFKCCNVRSPLVTCVPTEKEVLIASCNNEDSQSTRSCEYTSAVGTVMDYIHQMTSIIFYSSIGYTVECAGKELQARFTEESTVACDNTNSTNRPCDFKWKNADPVVWDTVGFVKRVYSVPGRTKFRVYQTTGQCGQYIVRTNRIRREVTDTKTGEVRNEDISIPADTVVQQERGKCWMDNAEKSKEVIKFGDLGPKPENIPPFHGKPGPTSFRLSEPVGIVLRTPPGNIDFGQWQEWRNLSNGCYFTGVSIVKYSADEGNGAKDNMGVVTVFLKYQCLTGDMKEGKEEFHTPGFTMADPTDMEWALCPAGGAVIGLQQNVLNDQGFEGDDVGTDDVKIICSTGEDKTLTVEQPEATDGVGQGSGDVGKWVEPQICKYRQIVCGMQAQMDTFNSVDVEYDNVGLSNFRILCCDVPNPAKVCAPEEKKVLLGSCDNLDSTLPTECEVEVPVGTAYRYKGNEKSIHFHESIGYTLACAKKDLRETFKSIPCQSDNSCGYKDPMPPQVLQSLSYTTVPLKVPGRTKLDIYQYQGHCGFYRIFTNELEQVEQNLAKDNGRETASKLVAPLPKVEDEVCPIDSVPLAGGDLPLITKGPKRLPKYEKPVSNPLYSDVDDSGPYLMNPLVTDRGNWDTWHNCPNGTYAVGLNNNRRVVTTGNEKDQAGLTAIALLCQSPERKPGSEVYITSNISNVSPPDWASIKSHFCEEGAGIGIMVNSQEDQGPGDDVAMDNIQLLCSYGRPAYKNYEGPHYTEVSGLRGTWRDKVFCKAKHTICGLKTQGEPFVQKADLATYDNTGINNIMTRCCQVEDPAAACTPKEEKILAATCNNSDSSETRQCNYLSSVGVAEDFENMKSAVYFYQSIGYTTPCVSKKLQKRFEKMKCPSKCLYNWDRPDPGVFYMITDTMRNLPIPGKTKIQLFQVVGSCGMYQVASPKYIKVTENLQTGEKTEEPLDVPVKVTPKQDKLNKCWIDTTDIDGDIPIAELRAKRPRKHVKNNATGARPIRKEDDGIVIQTPQITNWGEFGEWQHCPNGSFVNGISTVRQKLVNDYAGVGTFSAKCTFPNLTETATLEYNPKNGFPQESSENSKAEWAMCGEGTSIGIQANSMSDLGEGEDNAATENIKLVCSYKPEGAFNPYTSPDKHEQFTGHKGAWTEKQLCQPQQAISGFRPQYHAYKENEDFTGLNNLRAKCKFVEDPAKECIPKEERLTIASCDNMDGSTSRNCTYHTRVGVAYNHTSVEIERSIVFYESIGYTLECAPKSLMEAMANNCTKCKYDWKATTEDSPVWGKLQTASATKPVPGGKSFSVQQLVYNCGFYTIFTDRYFKISDGDKGQEEVVEPLPPKEPFPECWMVNAPINADALYKEKDKRPDKICQFHGLSPSRGEKIDGGFILSSPKITDWGEWNDWKNCSSNDTYINKIRVLRHEITDGTNVDKAGVVQFALNCKNVLKDGLDTPLEFVNPGLKQLPWENWYECKDGVAVGFHVHSVPEQVQDDIATEDVRLICSCSPDAAVPFESHSGTWTERQICKPLQALVGLTPQFQQFKNAVSKSYDNVGLNNVKMSCKDVPSLAMRCTPVEEIKSVARCLNQGTKSRECIFHASVGVTYNYTKDNLPVINVFESVGHTLPCSVKPLKTNFQQSTVCKQCEFPWDRKGLPIWQELKGVTGNVEAPPKSIVEIFQVFGTCDPYIVHSNRFLKQVSTRGSGGNMGKGDKEKIDLPVDSVPASCWSDDGPIFIGEEKPDDNFCPFPEIYSDSSFVQDVGGSILTSPVVTDFGNWGEWKLCPTGSFIQGLSPQRSVVDSNGMRDSLGLANVGFRCITPEGTEAEVLSVLTPNLPSKPWRKWVNCGDSITMSFQLNSQYEQGSLDDVATDNLLLECACGPEAVNGFDDPNAEESGGVQGVRGDWTERQTCQPKQALCGVQGQIQPFVPSDKITIIDNVGVDGIKMKCCAIDSPAETCEPVEKRYFIGSCDNIEGFRTRICVVSLYVGIAYDAAKGNVISRFYESIGYTKECVGNEMEAHFRTQIKCQKECEFDWKSSPEAVWKPNDLFIENITVPARTKYDIYQVVAECSYFRTKSNRYVQVVSSRSASIPNMEKFVDVPVGDLSPGDTCWEEDKPIRPTSGDKILLEPNKVKFRPMEESPTHEVDENGINLISPVDTYWPEVTEDTKPEYCNPPNEEDSWYVDSVFVERQGSPAPNEDLAGLVAVAFHCRNTKRNGMQDHYITGFTPGAPISQDSVWDWRRCECGAGIGYQVSSVPDQRLGDDLGIESFKLICSCSPTVWKTMDEFPKLLAGLRGNWTQEQLCKPRQVLCGLQTRNKPFKLADNNLFNYDNFGVTRVKAKCCDVPNIAVTCKAKESLREIAICDNIDRDVDKKCIIDTVIGVTYNYASKDMKNLATFYESIGWGLDCVIDELQENFRDNIGTNNSEYYPWSDKRPIWATATFVQDVVKVAARDRTTIHQIIGECGPYIVATDRFIRSDVKLDEDVSEDFYFYTKFVIPPARICWTEGFNIRARDYIATPDFNVSYHGYPAPTKFTSAGPKGSGILIESSVNLPFKSESPLEKCQNGSYITGFASDSIVHKSKTGDEFDDLGMTHVTVKCRQLSSEGPHELKAIHPDVENNPERLSKYMQECNGVAVGFQISLTLPENSKGKDQIGIENIRMLCSHGKLLESPRPVKSEWSQELVACRQFQALCSLQAKFGPKPDGNWKKVDGTGITNLKMGCCEVKNPALGEPHEVLRLASVCDNLIYNEDRRCDFSQEIGITYDVDNFHTMSFTHLSIGYTIGCVHETLLDTFKTVPIVCETGTCINNWESAPPQIFQPGIAALLNSTKIAAFTRIDIFQVVGKVNNLMVMTNIFEFVTKNKDGEEVSRERFSLNPDSFPTVENASGCVNTEVVAGKKLQKKVRDKATLQPTNEFQPSNPKQSCTFHGRPVWEDYEQNGLTPGDAILSSLPLTDVEVNQALEWQQWLNCSENTYIEAISPHRHMISQGKQQDAYGIAGFYFRCAGPQGEEELNEVEASTRGVALPATRFKGCQCPSSIGIGVHTSSKPYMGVEDDLGLVDMSLICSCGSPAKIEVTDWLKTNAFMSGEWGEPMHCQDRSALCGFQIQDTKSVEDKNLKVYDNLGINRIRASCCRVPSAVNQCKPAETLQKVIQCDNGNNEISRNCEFDLNIGLTYDYQLYERSSCFYELVGWSIDCVSVDLAKKFGEILGPETDAMNNWAAAAKEVPMGQEWDKVLRGSYKLKVAELTNLEIFQVIGECNMYRVYTDVFLLRETSSKTGAVKETQLDINLKDDTGELIRNPPECWLDKRVIKGQSVLVNKNRARPFHKGFHNYVPTDKGVQLSKLSALQIQVPAVPIEPQSWAETVQCKTGSYVKQFSVVPAIPEGDKTSPVGAIYFKCNKPGLNDTDAVEHKLTLKTLAEDEKWKSNGVIFYQGSFGAFVGVQTSTLKAKNGGIADVKMISSTGPDADFVWTRSPTAGVEVGDVEHCGPGQAVCGYQAAWGDMGLTNLRILCCSVESPVLKCTPSEKLLLAGVCDNRRDGRKRKCEVKFGVGVAYNFRDHDKSSYFYSSLGFTPNCTISDLRKKFQTMHCPEGTCDFSWGSAAVEMWRQLKVTPHTFDMEPNSRLEFHQQLGVCSFENGEILVLSTVLNRVSLDSSLAEVKSSQYVISGVLQEEEPKCNIQFKDLSIPPAPPPVIDTSPLRSKCMNPPDEPRGPKCPFHGIPESDSFDYSSATTAGSSEIVLSGPTDPDLKINLKPTWRKWGNCSSNSFMNRLETYVAVLINNKTGATSDALGVHSINVQCGNANGENRPEEFKLSEVGPELAPPKRISKPCQSPAVAVGFEVQWKPYQGPVADDTGFVNFKQLCSCGPHAVVDFSGLDSSFLLNGDWTAPQVCRPREAICGYIHESSDYEPNAGMIRFDNVAISGIKGKCCPVSSPAILCKPSESLVMSTICDNSGFDNDRKCEVEAYVGLSYTYSQKEKPSFYESIGWNLECVKEELSAKFAQMLGGKSGAGKSAVVPDFDWNANVLPGSDSKIWHRVVKGTKMIDIKAGTTSTINQLIGTCGIYKVHTDIFVRSDVSTMTGDESEDKFVVDIGNKEPEPCWADLSPLKGRSWLVGPGTLSNASDAQCGFHGQASTKSGIVAFDPKDGTDRTGILAQTPTPPVPAFEWYPPHVCPNNTYIRSISVNKVAVKDGDTLDLIGVVAIGYHCMSPNMTTVEEKLHVHKSWTSKVDEWRAEFFGDPGSRYQTCLGAAVGVEIEASLSGKGPSTDEYGIFDIRFVCGCGRDMEYTFRPPDVSVKPDVARDVVCRSRQALCSLQASFAEPPTVERDDKSLENLKIGCCNIPSPVASCEAQETLLLSATCDNQVYNRVRKCKYTVGVGIGYDMKNEEKSSYFYLSVGYTPTCLSQELKEKMESGKTLKCPSGGCTYSWSGAPPQVFQEVKKFSRVISLEPKTRVDIYQVVAVCNGILVMTNNFVMVTLDEAFKELKRVPIVEDKLPKSVVKKCEAPVELDIPPPALPPTPAIPVPHLHPPSEKSSKPTCPFQEKQDLAIYTLADDGSNYIEGWRDLDIEVNHKTSWTYPWNNCSTSAAYFNQFNYNRGEVSVPEGESGKQTDAYGIDSLIFQCVDFSAGEEPISTETCELHNEGSTVNKAKFTSPNDDSVLKQGFKCNQGVGIGFTMSVKPFQRVLDDVAFDNFRMHCSCEADAVGVAGETKSTSIGDWSDARYCRPKEALCGFTIRAQKLQKEPLRVYDNLAISNLRMKCCPMESPVSGCSPVEAIVMVAVCNNIGGSQQKDCLVDYYVGLTYDYRPEVEPQIQTYNSVGWTLDCVREELSEKFVKSVAKSKKSGDKPKVDLSWAEMSTDKPLGKVWNTMSKKVQVVSAPSDTTVEIHQIIGSCAFYKIYTHRFAKVTKNKEGKVVKEDIENYDAIASSRKGKCWEEGTPIRGRDWMITASSSLLQCPPRAHWPSASKQDLADLQVGANYPKSGLIIQTPQPELPYLKWSEWKLCPKGTFLRGWTSVASGKNGVNKAGKQTDDYSGIVFVKGICQSPDNSPSESSEIALLQEKNDWQEQVWKKQGKYGVVHCVGTGIGIQGMIQMKPKPSDDKFYFHDTKLICSCGQAAFVREGVPPINDAQKKRDALASPQKQEVCKSRHALCGLKVSWGPSNIGDFSQQDGHGVSNLQGLCCEVPSPVSNCQTEEKLVFASACDNSKGTVQRRCVFNLVIGIAYNYEKHEAASYFYASNGFTPTCIALDVRSKFTENIPKPCSEQGCKFPWAKAMPQIWQETVTISQIAEVPAGKRLRIYQVVGQCQSVSVLTNYFVRVIADKNGAPMSRDPWIIDDLAPPKMKKCEAM